MTKNRGLSCKFTMNEPQIVSPQRTQSAQRRLQSVRRASLMRVFTPSPKRVPYRLPLHEDTQGLLGEGVEVSGMFHL